MGAECFRCGYDMYDECGHCAVVDERDHYRTVLEEIAGVDEAVPGEMCAHIAAQVLRQYGRSVGA